MLWLETRFLHLAQVTGADLVLTASASLVAAFVHWRTFDPSSEGRRSGDSRLQSIGGRRRWREKEEQQIHSILCSSAMESGKVLPNKALQTMQHVLYVALHTAQHTYSGVRVSSLKYTLHTTTKHVITVLERQSLKCYVVVIHVRLCHSNTATT